MTEHEEMDRAIVAEVITAWRKVDRRRRLSLRLSEVHAKLAQESNTTDERADFDAVMRRFVGLTDTTISDAQVYADKHST